MVARQKFIAIGPNGVRVSGVKIYLEQTDGMGNTFQGITDNFGTYEFEGVPKGNYQYAMMKRSDSNPYDNYRSSVGTVQVSESYREFPVQMTFMPIQRKDALMHEGTKEEAIQPRASPLSAPPSALMVIKSVATFPLRVFDAANKGEPMPTFMEVNQ
jgi:hypothetical protein